MTIKSSELELYKQRFIPLNGSNTLRLRPYGYQAIEDHPKKIWVRNNDWYLTDGVLKAHLGGRYWVGGIGGAYTKHLALDLDAGADLEERLSLTLSAFPDAYPLKFTSPGDGFHSYYFLDRPVWAAQARAWAKEQLAQVGLTIQNGKVELFPSGLSLRLPCGAKSYLIDPQDHRSLEPVGDQQESLRVLFSVLKHDQLDYLTIPSSYHPKKRSQKRLNAASEQFKEEIEILYLKGIQTPGTRHELLLKLNRFLVLSNMSEDQRIEEMWTWLKENHNGNSKDYPAYPQRCYDEICRIARSNYQPQQQYPTNLPTRIQPDGAITSYVAGLELSLAQRNLLTKILILALNTSASIQEDWAEIKITRNLFRNWSGGRYRKHVDSLIAQGYLQDLGGHSIRHHKCKKYKVKMEFLTQPISLN